MKDVVTPVAPEEVRAMIQTSLENAALLNYTQLSQKANIEGKFNNKGIIVNDYVLNTEDGGSSVPLIVTIQ